MSNDNTNSKTCTKCGNMYPATTGYFYANKDGLRAMCKVCAREWRQANKEKLQEYNRAYYQTNRDKLLEYVHEYQQVNKDKIAAYDREYYQANRDKIRENAREYRQSNKDKITEQNRKWRQANPDKIAEYYRDNSDKYRIFASRRRARMRSLPDTFTEAQWYQCLEYHRYCCAVCGNQMRDLLGTIEPHADHWIPLSSDECTGTIATNMICLCSTCNLSKQDKLPDVWLEEKFGTRKANEILKRVQVYFEFISNADETGII